MIAISIQVADKTETGLFHAAFAGVWVVHPASTARAFSRVRGFTAQAQAERVLRELVTRDRSLPCMPAPDAPPAPPEAYEWHLMDAAPLHESPQEEHPAPAQATARCAD